VLQNHQDKHSSVSSVASPVPAVVLPKAKGGKNATHNHFPGGKQTRHFNGTHSGHRHKNGTSRDVVTTIFATRTVTLTRTVTSTNNVQTQEALPGSGEESTTTAVAPESDDSEAEASEDEEAESGACVAPVYVTVTHKKTLVQVSTIRPSCLAAN
jgi:hypothetical protein